MVPFIVLGHPRNGSTLLTTTLGQHEQVRMFGELFNDEEEERRRAFRAGRPIYREGRLVNRAAIGRPEAYAEDADGAAFLRDEIFYRRYMEDPFAVGFKIFYDQARSPSAQSAWTHLILTENIRVIHLRRANLLESFVSLRLALLTSQWVWPKDAGMPPQPGPISLDPEETKAYFDRVVRQFEWAREAFCGHQVLELEYARDLSSQFDTTLGSVQEFLGLRFQLMEPLLAKQARRPPHVQISNYCELKAYFAATPYWVFFESAQAGGGGF